MQPSLQMQERETQAVWCHSNLTFVRTSLIVLIITMEVYMTWCDSSSSPPGNPEATASLPTCPLFAAEPLSPNIPAKQVKKPVRDVLTSLGSSADTLVGCKQGQDEPMRLKRTALAG